MIINSNAKKWLTKANRDFLAAEKLLEFSEDSSLTEAICLHSAESVEKFLKAYDIQNEIPFEDTDTIADIIAKCCESEPEFGDLKTGNIAAYLGKVWSPEHSLPSLKEAHEAFRAAQSVRTFILDKLHLHVKDLS